MGRLARHEHQLPVRVELKLEDPDHADHAARVVRERLVLPPAAVDVGEHGGEDLELVGEQYEMSQLWMPCEHPGLQRGAHARPLARLRPVERPKASRNSCSSR